MSSANVTQESFGVVGSGGDSMPVGSIIAWAEDLQTGGLDPSGPWRRCDGSVLNEPTSPLHGLRLPDLNSTPRFLRGATSQGYCWNLQCCGFTQCPDANAYGGADGHTHTGGDHTHTLNNSTGLASETFGAGCVGPAFGAGTIGCDAEALGHQHTILAETNGVSNYGPCGCGNCSLNLSVEGNLPSYYSVIWLIKIFPP